MEDNPLKGLNACDSRLTSETPFARRAFISSSLSSGQAMGEAEASAMKYVKKAVRRGRCMSNISVRQATNEDTSKES